MARATLRLVTVVVWLVLPGRPVFAGAKDVCVSVSGMYLGRNCGTADSVQVEVRNDCGVTIVGDVVFQQASGDPIRYHLTLKAGDKQTVWVCHGNGTVGKDFDIRR